jgi:hypothetical protein
VNEHLKRSRKQEKRGAKEFGGYTNPRSGGGDWHKNDVRSDDYSIEYKTTTKKQYPLKLADLLTADKHALLAGREMLFVIEFDTEDREFVIMNKHHLFDLIEGLQEGDI